MAEILEMIMRRLTGLPVRSSTVRRPSASRPIERPRATNKAAWRASQAAARPRTTAAPVGGWSVRIAFSSWMAPTTRAASRGSRSMACARMRRAADARATPASSGVVGAHHSPGRGPDQRRATAAAEGGGRERVGAGQRRSAPSAAGDSEQCPRHRVPPSRVVPGPDRGSLITEEVDVGTRFAWWIQADDGPESTTKLRREIARPGFEMVCNSRRRLTLRAVG